MVTIHTIKPDSDSPWKGVISPDRVTKSREPVKVENAAGIVSNHTMDTTQEAYYRANESSSAASTPKSRFDDGGDVYSHNITQNDLKVKSDGYPEYPTNETLEKLLSDDDIRLPDTEVDGNITTKTAKERLAEIKKEENDASEIISCMLNDAPNLEHRSTIVLLPKISFQQPIKTSAVTRFIFCHLMNAIMHSIIAKLFSKGSNLFFAIAGTKFGRRAHFHIFLC